MYDTMSATINAPLGAAQDHYPQAKQRLAQIKEQLVEQKAGLLRQHFPQADPAAHDGAAYRLLCLVPPHDMLPVLVMDPRHTVQARAG